MSHMSDKALKYSQLCYAQLQGFSKKYNGGGSSIFHCGEGLNKVHNRRVLQDEIYALFHKFSDNLLLGWLGVARGGKL